MSYEKKVVVLKQIENGYSQPTKTLGGIVRVEKENEVSSLFLSLINFAPATSGEYCLFITDGKQNVFKFPLGKYPRSLTQTFNDSPELLQGIAAGVCVVADDIPLLVAYQRSDDCKTSLSDFKKSVAEKCAEARKQRQKAEDSPVYNMKTRPSVATADESATTERGKQELFVAEKENFTEYDVPPEYDDEAVATENFYDVDESIKTRTELLKSYADERADSDVPPFKRESDEYCSAPDDNDGLKSEKPNDSPPDFIFSNGEKKYNESNPYYATVEKELADLFDKFPAERQLEKTLYGGRFVKINYSAEKYYVAGIIKERDEAKYICYGVPAVYSKTPPKELDGYCSFIPLSVFDLKGDGYWMMFQDAVTGECIKPK